MIQEALCSLSESTSGAGGCSLLNVLLYILNKYEDADDGNVQVIHAKVTIRTDFSLLLHLRLAGRGCVKSPVQKEVFMQQSLNPLRTVLPESSRRPLPAKRPNHAT